MLQGLINKYKNLKQSIISINWDNSWEEESEYLKFLIQKRRFYPSNPIYDTLFQFKAQVFGVSKKDLILLNLVSFFGFLYLILKFYIRKQNFASKYDVAYFYSLNIFERQLQKNKKMIFIEGSEGMLTLKELALLFKLMFTFKFNFIILSTVTFRLAQIKYAIKKYGVSEIWTNMEYSCASGVLKYYCNEKKIRFLNFMHGEKVLTLRDAFSSFDKFYVWDSRYVELVKKMNSNSELLISNPWEETCINRSKLLEINSICYFFKGIETSEEILQLQIAFKKLTTLGYKIYVKDHPRQNVVSLNFKNVNIINRDTSFLELTERINFFVAQYSTILTQCEMLGVNYLVDDMSNVELASKLKERGYLIAQNTNLLSKFLNEKTVL